MILFLFAIVFIAQLIITTVIIVKLIDIDIAIIVLDEKIQAYESVTKCSLYYLKEVTEAYKELTTVTIDNFEKKFRKSNNQKLRTATMSVLVALLPKGVRRFIESSKWGFKVVKYFYNL